MAQPPSLNQMQQVSFGAGAGCLRSGAGGTVVQGQLSSAVNEPVISGTKHPLNVYGQPK